MRVSPTDTKSPPEPRGAGPWAVMHKYPPPAEARISKGIQ